MLLPQMDNNTVFVWHTLVFSILRDILLGSALPIVKVFIISQPLGEMLSNGRQLVSEWHLHKYFMVIMEEYYKKNIHGI